MERITSKDNEKIKWLIKLQNSRKVRQESASFVAEGMRLAQEVLRCGLPLQQVFASDDGAARYASVWNALCQKASAAYLISDGLEAKISSVQTPQGIYCVCGMPRHTFGQIAGFGEKFLALDHLQDPGNLGTIIRTAEGAGVTGIILSADTVDIYNPKVIRSTMGSIFRMPIVVADDLAETIDHVKARGISVYGAHLDGASFYEKDFTGSCAFLIGNEGNGLSDEISAKADDLIRIPMCGQVESLNAAISTAVIAYEVLRQRSTGKK